MFVEKQDTRYRMLGLFAKALHFSFLWGACGSPSAMQSYAMYDQAQPMMMDGRSAEYNQQKMAALREVANRAKAVSSQLSAMQLRRAERLEASPNELNVQRLPAWFTGQDRPMNAQRGMERDEMSMIQQGMQTAPSMPQPPMQEAQYLNQKLQNMQSDLLQERSSQAALHAENSKLKEELASWMSAGKQVAAREANVIGLLEKARANRTAAVSKQQAHHNLAYPFVSLWMMLYVVIIVLVIAVLLRCSFKGDGSSKSPPIQSVFGAVSRYMNKNYVLEISEIQVALPGTVLCGDIGMTLQVGRGERKYATKTIEVGESSNSFLKFRDVLPFKVKSSDGACIFSIVDKDFACDRIAHVDVAAKELLALAHRPHGEYVRFNLTLQGLRPTHVSKTEAYIAMRLKDVTKMPTGSAILGKRAKESDSLMA